MTRHSITYISLSIHVLQDVKSLFVVVNVFSGASSFSVVKEVIFLLLSLPETVTILCWRFKQ